LNSTNEALNGISSPPVPHSMRAKVAATKPITPKNRCPVRSNSIIDANMRRAMAS
jgi:hypothetical protein